MSQYSFIASDYEISEVDNSKERFITVREAMKLGLKPHEFMPWESMDPNTKILYIDKESELGELVIAKCDSNDPYMENIKIYTNKPYIYSVDFTYSQKRGNELLKHMKDNIKEGTTMELWTIWLDEKDNIEPKTVSKDEVSTDDLKEMYLIGSEDYVGYGCLIIK